MYLKPRKVCAAVGQQGEPFPNNLTKLMRQKKLFCKQIYVKLLIVHLLNLRLVMDCCHSNQVVR